MRGRGYIQVTGSSTHLGDVDAALLEGAVVDVLRAHVAVLAPVARV